ncbi:hypothetical protein RQP46_002367 [Phenoliferia psychrophenolica]
MLSAVLALSLGVSPAFAAIAATFQPPALGPTSTSTNYTGASNSTLVNSPVVPGKAFDRFIQIWLENTDFATAASSPVFQSLTSKGMLMSGYHGVTHPSEPNYIAAACGDFFGLGDDAFYAVPSNVSTIVDLLEAKNISWASYQENMPYDGFQGFNYTEKNYLNSSAGDYTYYVRKHNPTIMADSVAKVPARAARHRNFNDFAVDVNASAMPQWSFITPNLVNDAHDTTIDFTSEWLSYFLVPLLENPLFNDNRTLILLTFDESESTSINNQIYTVALGGALPTDLVNTTDPTYYTHYSSLSTVQNNWGLGSLGRGDTSPTKANVYDFVAKMTNHTNNGLTIDSLDLPLTNITGNIPGPLNSAYWQPVLAPNASAIGAGGGPVFISAGTDMSLTSSSTVNLTAMGVRNPDQVIPTTSGVSPSAAASATGTAAASPAKGSSGASRLATPAMGVLALVAAIVL